MRLPMSADHAGVHRLHRTAGGQFSSASPDIRVARENFLPEGKLTFSAKPRQPHSKKTSFLAASWPGKTDLCPLDSISHLDLSSLLNIALIEN